MFLSLLEENCLESNKNGRKIGLSPLITITGPGLFPSNAWGVVAGEGELTLLAQEALHIWKPRKRHESSSAGPFFLAVFWQLRFYKTYQNICDLHFAICKSSDFLRLRYFGTLRVLGRVFGRTDLSWMDFLFGRRFFCGVCRRILSPHFCGRKCPEESSRKIPGKILQNLYNKNPRYISAEGTLHMSSLPQACNPIALSGQGLGCESGCPSRRRQRALREGWLGDAEQNLQLGEACWVSAVILQKNFRNPSPC